MSKNNNFKKDLAWGEIGVDYLISKLKHPCEKTNGFAGDIIMLDTGNLIEAKFDRRIGNANLFLEHYSHKTKQTLGGPFKALADNCLYFVYIFAPCKSIYIYKTQDLVDFLNDNKNNIRYHVVYQSNATGYITPIVDLRHLELKLEDII